MAFRPEHNLYNFHPALRESIPLEKRGKLKQPENFAGGGPLRINHQIQAQLVL